MRIFRDIKELPNFKNAVITIGSFDGVHRGHQKIIKRINHLANEIDGESVIITFDPHPRKIIYPKDDTLVLLNTLDEKIDLIERFGVDNLVIVPFSVEFSQQPPREYIERFLLNNFNPSYIVIGYDHRFGLNREGNIDLLAEYSTEHNFKVTQIKKQELEDITISSSKIRDAIKEGDIEEANQFLNHKYKISGVVSHGDKIGKTIGYPTANIKVEEKSKLIPQEGVYVVICDIEGLEKNGMMYIGTRPSISGVIHKQKIEVNIFDFNDDIYNKPIEVSVLRRLRGDQKFDSLNDLKDQLAKDEIAARESLDTSSVDIQSQDKVCVAILNWNGEEYLESYLPQVLYSSSEPINIAVIDNASDDESVAYVQDWHPEVQLIQLPKNYGFAEGYNRGLKYIDSKYTVILNSDVNVKTEWLDPIIKAMDEDPQLAICQPKILSLEEKELFEYAGASGGFLDSLSYPYCRGRIFDHIETDEGQYDNDMHIDWASGAAMVVRTQVFKNLGGFDNDYFAHMEEIDFCIRARKCGYKIKVIPQSIVYHLGGGTLDYSSPRKVNLNFRNSLYTLFKNESGGSLAWKLPARLILDGVAAAKFLAEGKVSHIKAIIGAHWTFFGQIPNLMKKRKALKNLVQKYKIGSPISRSKHSSSIVLDFYLRGRKTFDKLSK
ncbi:MAG: riboflavin kinase/FMN adenylyltransferase [Saprospiraceae bacterium]|jgi:riboflavin kinase/FMN adenylyltransferase